MPTGTRATDATDPGPTPAARRLQVVIDALTFALPPPAVTARDLWLRVLSPDEVRRLRGFDLAPDPSAPDQNSGPLAPLLFELNRLLVLSEGARTIVIPALWADLAADLAERATRAGWRVEVDAADGRVTVHPQG